MNIEIRGLNEAIKYMSDLQKNQLPFATAKALTMTAKDVQAEVIKTLPERFTLRTPWYKTWPYGFLITPAIKTRLEATVYSKAPFMTLQEEGGVKTPRGRMIAVPTNNIRRTKRDLIKEDQRPAYLLKGYRLRGASKAKGMGKRAERSGNIAFIKEINGVLGIWQRVGRGKDTTRLMYTLIPRADIQPRLFFYQTGKKVVDMKFNQNFGTAMNDALRTAK